MMNAEVMLNCPLLRDSLLSFQHNKKGRRPFGLRPFFEKEVFDCWLARLGNVAGLRPLRTVDDLELDRLAFLERPEAVPLDRREVHKHVTPAFALDETIALGVVEPLDLASNTHVLAFVVRTPANRRQITRETPLNGAPEHKKGRECGP